MQEANVGSSPILSTQYSVLSTPHSSDRHAFRLPYPRLVAALLTGGLLFACYFPLNCGWLAWTAVVPLLCLVRGGASKKRLFF
jgi:apolipoprotein N-acyltransferase